MNKKTLLIVSVVVVGLIFMYGLSVYNGLVRANEGADGQWAQVESQYQRRFDLIPNLVSSVQGAMKQEQVVFGVLADARTKYAGAVTVDEKAAAASQVESALGRLIAVMENYPELKSMEVVQALMGQLEGSENRISVERMRFNEMIRSYNVMVKVFPKSVLASMFGFSERNYFEAAEGSEVAPKVNL